MANTAVLFELKCSQQDAKELIDEYGDEVKFYLRSESNVTRDKYNSLENVSATEDLLLTTDTFPIVDSPTNKQLEKAGLTEKADLMITTAMKCWLDASIDVNNIDLIRMTVVVDNITYRAKEKSHSVQIANGYIYLNFGLSVK